MQSRCFRRRRRSAWSIARPELEGDDQVRLRMLEVGVCGTDHEIARFEYGTPPAGEPYLVMGHESLGEVVEVGSAVTSIKPGDLVVTTVRRPCGAARVPPLPAQPAGLLPDRRLHRARHQGPARLHDRRGGRQAKNMHVVPREIADIAVLTEPLTIAEKALIELDSVLVRMPWINPGQGREAGPQRRGPGRGARSGCWARWRCWCAGSTPGSTRARAPPARAPPGSRSIGAQLHRVERRCRSASSASGSGTSI